MKKSLICLVIITSVLFQNCALIFSGCRDKIKVHGNTPYDARVYYNGEQVGTGNCTVKIHKKSINNAIIEVKADGYESQTFRFSKKLKILAFLGDCVGFVWLIGDFATGAIYKAKPQNIHYELHPINAAISNDFKSGDKILFSFEQYKNEEGVIKAIYPNRALITYIKKNGKQIELEVPLMNIAKK